MYFSSGVIYQCAGMRGVNAENGTERWRRSRENGIQNWD